MQSHTFQVTIDGMLAQPVQLSMSQLLSMGQPVSITTYMACTGNRRKELRAVKPLQGSDMGRTGAGPMALMLWLDWVT
jgi:sulfite oxidase